LRSFVQVHWAMEAVGHSFTLPMEDAGVIYSALRVYSRW
jgi:hypothetical protein